MAHPAASAFVRILALGVVLTAPAARAGQPMDLGEGASRWVSVRFEVSPPDRPGQLETAYTAELPAWLDAGALPGQIRVTVAGSVVETGFLRPERVRPGSFSDFVWIFDAVSGDVISARLSGTLIRRLDLGVVQREVETPFAAEMSTRAAAGFEPGRRVFGQLVFPFCARAGGGCTLVQPRPYDRRTGYVNAVGQIVGRAMGIPATTFSPLGEAIFSESELTPRAGLATAR